MAQRARDWFMNLSFYAGAVLCAVVLLIRIRGPQLIYGSEPLSVFILGVGLMVFYCALKLHSQP